MRRLDAIGIGLGVLLSGGIIYLVLQLLGIDGLTAGIWTQLLLVIALIIWTLSYLGRVLRKDMTYNQQLKDYQEAVLQKRLEEMSETELEQLQAEIAREKES